MKAKRFIGCSLLLLGLFLVLGAVGGLEHNTCTIGETLKNCVAGFGMVFIAYWILERG